jgi:hypothetical protein
MRQTDAVTTTAKVKAYKSSHLIFDGLIREIRELSKKKSEATLSAGKVKIINRVLKDLCSFLSEEPEGKYLDPLNDDELPQTSDAVLVMVQYESALSGFKSRYFKYRDVASGWAWATEHGYISDGD